MSGTGFIKLMMEYPDGHVVAIPMCKNVGKPIKTDEERNGVAKSAQILDPDTPRSMQVNRPIITPKVCEMKNYYNQEAFIQYERPDFPIPINIIWQRIAELWEKIPIEDWYGTFTYEEAYQGLLDVGGGKAEQFQDDGFVLLTKKEIEEVAEEIGYIRI